MSSTKSDVAKYHKMRDDNETHQRGHKERIKNAKKWGKRKAKEQFQSPWKRSMTKINTKKSS